MPFQSGIIPQPELRLPSYGTPEAMPFQNRMIPLKCDCPGPRVGQSHERILVLAGTALKGHGFSRAETWREKRPGFSR